MGKKKGRICWKKKRFALPRRTAMRGCITVRLWFYNGIPKWFGWSSLVTAAKVRGRLWKEGCPNAMFEWEWKTRETDSLGFSCCLLVVSPKFLGSDFAFLHIYFFWGCLLFSPFFWICMFKLEYYYNCNEFVGEYDYYNKENNIQKFYIELV